MTDHVHSTTTCAVDAEGLNLWWLCGHEPMFTPRPPVEPEKKLLVIDIVARRPACAIVQAAFIDHDNGLLSLFEPKSWLTSPTESMTVIAGTYDEFRTFADEVNERFKP